MAQGTLRSAQVEVADPLAAIEAHFDKGWTDGLPFDPTDGPMAKVFTPAPRPAGLEGKVIGILDNGKAKSCPWSCAYCSGGEPESQSPGFAVASHANLKAQLHPIHGHHPEAEHPCLPRLGTGRYKRALGKKIQRWQRVPT
jgi:hypothetical protein